MLKLITTAQQAGFSPITWSNKPLASLAYMAVVGYQLYKHSVNRRARPNVSSPLWALIRNQVDNALRGRRYRRKMAAVSQVTQ